MPYCLSVCRVGRLLVIASLFAAAQSFCFAQGVGAAVSGAGPGTSLGSITGTTVDPTGAVIPQASISATRAGHAPVTAKSDGVGHFSLSRLAPGTYVIEAQAPNFRLTRKEGVRVTSGATVTLTLTLAIEADQQSITVSADTLDASPEKNGGAIVLKGEDLQALSDDPDELSTQLQAMAGADAETGTQFYVDGFTAGRLPPKSSIREIRINQNPYSAQYDSLGFGRIEILTKPGTDKLHAEYWMQGNNSPWNAQNPFVTEQPPYYMYQLDGDLNGPVGKNASYFFSIWHRQAINVSVVNAEILDDSLNPVPFTQAISAPGSGLFLTPRFDWQWGKVHTMSLRYELERSTAQNSGVGQFQLASQAFDSTQTEQVLQFTDSQAWSAKVLNEVRFQYIRDRNSQAPHSFDPTLAVQGAFTGGGNNTGVQRDAQDHYELQDILRINHGTHDLTVGGRLRVIRDSNYSTANYNGQYTFATLTAYQITEQGIANQWTPEEIRAAGGGASLFSQTMGNPGIVVSMADAGIFAENNWKVIPSVVLSPGLRFESQTGIHDHADFGPRLGIAWSVPGGKNKPPRAVIRGGTGFFFQRFTSSGLLQAERQNGITQTAVVIDDPDFYPDTCRASPLPPQCSGGSQSAPTIFSINPDLRAPYLFIAGFGVDKSIGKHVSLSANYLYSRGDHLFITRNINAPLPGTYNPADPTSGERPLGIDENIYQYNSQGASARSRLSLNGGLNTKKTGLWGYYTISRVDANTSGLTSFPSNQYDINADWGRAAYDIRNRAFIGGYTRLPGNFSLNPFLIVQSSAPFNIVVGEDLNGDTQFNDRPAFATDLTRPSVYVTKWGTFDAAPMPGQKIIPINYGKGPGLFVANLRLSRRFNFGPALPEDPAPPVPAANLANANTANRSPAKPEKKEIERKYTLSFGASAQNILNHPNFAPPVGVLGSSLFGQSTALSSTFGNSSANRTINVETSFRF
jgi:Carboxypeptidase regulatory-like domain